MASAIGFSDIVYRSANNCVQLFSELCKITTETSWAEDQRARFNLWTADLGVFAAGHASTDYRLQHSPNIVQVIDQLLRALEANLMYILRKPSDISPNAGDGSQGEGSSDSPVSSLTVPSLDSTEEPHGGVAGPISQSCVNIEEGITRLNAISISVRRSGARYRDKRAESFIDKDRDGEDLTALFAQYITHIINDKFPDASLTIRRRIAQSIAQRRNRLAYLRKHQRKLAKERPKQQALLPAAIISSQKISPATPSLVSVSIQSRTQSATVLSDTSATKTDIDHVRLPITSQMGSKKSSSVISGASFKARTLDIPRAPDVLLGRTEFKCPYCCQLCAARDSIGERWKRHIMKDLMPYICIFDECCESQDFFRTFDDWIIHMRQQHKETKWVCIAPAHSPETFQDEELYKQHMQKDHAGTFAPSELPVLSRMSLRSTFQVFKRCPFCDWLPDRAKDSKSDLFIPEDQDFLQRHVAAHLESLSLMSLRWLDDLESVDPIEGTSMARMTDIGSNSVGGRPKFDDPPRHDPSAGDLYVDLDWKRLPGGDPIDDDKTWAVWCGSSENLVPSREDEWGFHWKTSLPQYGGHENDERLSPFIKRYEEVAVGQRVLPAPIVSSEDALIPLSRILREARIYSGDFKFFIPLNDLNRLITAPVVEGILKRNPNTEVNAKAYAHRVEKSAKKLFAVLEMQRNGRAICSLLDNNLSDQDLPFQHKIVDHQWSLWRREPEERINAFGRWENEDVEVFTRNQYCVTAPVFDIASLDCLELADEIVLPFIHLTEHEKENKYIRVGGYSEVTIYRIHPAHHNFWDTSIPLESQPLIAVKKLISADEREFLNEKTILDALGLMNHPNIITLLATYKQKGYYHLLFPGADHNLRTYWRANKLPEFDEETVLWSVEQMSGIISAINCIHAFKVEANLTLGDSDVVDSDVGDSRMKSLVKEGEEKFGRHGDIKPENIQYFEDGRLFKIADFGLAGIHGRDSRSGIDPRKIRGSLTYEPPECSLGRLISRKYDIWGLGCLFLEFVTWLLEGSEKIEEFADAREAWSAQDLLYNDKFFTLSATNDYIGDATVREGVIDWVGHLHAHEKCSESVHDLLDLIMTAMLKIDPSERKTALELKEIMQILVSRAKSNHKYLLNPVPRTLHAPTLVQESSTAQKSPTRPLAVRFADA